MCYYFSQVDIWSNISPMMRLQVRLTFSQASGQADLWSDIPHTETSCFQVYYYISKVDLWLNIYLAEISCGHVCYYFRQVDLRLDKPPMMRLHIRLTFIQASGQAGLWSDVPPWQRHVVAKCDTTSGQAAFGQT